MVGLSVASCHLPAPQRYVPPSPTARVNIAYTHMTAERYSPIKHQQHWTVHNWWRTNIG